MGRRKRLTITDIARIAGVSRTTASMVLNGHIDLYRISTATQERVLNIARENHFLPSQSGRALRSGCSNTIGLIIPDLTNYAQNRLAQAMEPLCQQAGYQMLLVTSNDDPLQEQVGVELLMAREVDGLIVVPSSPDPENYLKWSAQLPLVLVDRRIPENAALPFAVTDAQAAMMWPTAPGRDLVDSTHSCTTCGRMTARLGGGAPNRQGARSLPACHVCTGELIRNLPFITDSFK